MCICVPRAVACLAVVMAAGCRPATESDAGKKPPRPVSVFTLQESDPGRSHRVAGTVASWKTEQLGFEVAGRVQFVVEPDSDVEAAVYDAGTPRPGQNGTSAEPATTEVSRRRTVLARLDDTRYRLQVQSVVSQIESKKQQKKAALIEVEKVFPAQELVANSELRVARSELERRAILLRQKTISQEEYDRARTDWDKAQGQVLQLAAQKEAKRAETASLESQIQVLNESLAEATRDLQDCVLVAPYQGQVAEVHVIPGAYVERGQPVVTVQMMDPIAIEFEVSAETARRLGYRDMIPIHVSQPGGSRQERLASVYMTDPVADPQTRTFTATLLARNEKLRTPVPEDMQGKPIVRTDNLWKVLSQVFDEGEVQFVEENAVHEDGQGAFLWKVTNRQLGTLAGQANPKLDVVKVRVSRGKRKLPFLGGIWTFQEVAVREGETFDRAQDIVTGKMTFPPEIDAASWEGGTILFDRQRWLLRPGDLVRVDLRGGETGPGFYVPVSAILEQSGQSYVFAVESSGEGDRARRIEVSVFEAVDTLRRIQARGDQPLQAGMQIVADGALFLTDGEAVNVAEEVEVRR